MPTFDNAAFLAALAGNDLTRAGRLLEQRDDSLQWRLAEANFLARSGDGEAAIGRLEVLRRSGVAHPVAEFLLGTIHQSGGRWDDAVSAFARALLLRPSWGRALEALGCTLVSARRYPDAVSPLQRALKSGAVSPQGLLALGLSCLTVGSLEEGKAALIEAVRRSPSPSDTFQQISAFLVIVTFDDALDADAVMARYRAVGAVFDEAVPRLPPEVKPDPNPDRQLQIGYIGPSLHRHVLSDYLEPVLRHHDKEAVRVSVYAHVPEPDEVTRRMQGLVDDWVFIDEMSDEDAASRIRSDGIDILVHFMGHWIDNRLPVVARKPAPVQVSYLCQSPSTGLGCVDYTILGPGLEDETRPAPWKSEETVVLPSGHAATTDIESRPVAPEPPVFENQFTTFGSFNNPAKISDQSLAAWAKILQALPSARLIIKGRRLEALASQDALRHRFSEAGGPVDRLSFMGWVEADTYLDVYNSVDIVLDTFPFNGGRTTFEALWMGVPVVALTGRLFHERYSHIQLLRAGLGELSTENEGAYVAAAVALANDQDRLRTLRGVLRDRLLGSTLMNPAGHVRELEDAYRWMWRRYCARQKDGM